MDKNEYFFCYNLKLAKFLKEEKGIRYITHAIHPKTKSAFFLFKYNDQLSQAISSFKRLSQYYTGKNDID